MQPGAEYRLVKLPNGLCSIRSIACQETFHPVIGPAAEAEALYTRQLRLAARFSACSEKFVVWDVGLGAAANSLGVLRTTQGLPGKIQLASFDLTTAPLQFAFDHADGLGYFAGYEIAIERLLKKQRVILASGQPRVDWQLWLGDFPSLLAEFCASPNPPGAPPKPHAILFDPFSPAKNPAMWTLALFSRLYQCLSPSRPCALATYSRSTQLRVTLLLAGFFVGRGDPTGEKEETTVAANRWELIDQPLDQSWLLRARRSKNAEPLAQAAYQQAPLSPQNWELLIQHPQFSSSPAPAAC